MSLDKSLKIKNTMTGTRNVLKRGERIDQLKSNDKWGDDQSVYGLPKVRVIKTVIGKKKKKKTEDGDGDGDSASDGDK